MNKLPFMATENIMMKVVENGGNRQQLHEELRTHSQAAAQKMREGGENDLVDRIAADPMFNITKEEIEAVLRPELYVGRAPEQVEEYLRDFIQPILDENRDLLGEKAELSV